MKTQQQEREHFRRKLYEFQQIANMSEYALSHELGKCDSYVQSISSGKNMPSFSAFVDICAALQKETYEFFIPDRMDNETALSCIREMSEMTEGEQMEVLQFIYRMREMSHE